MNTTNVTRVELIDQNGRVVVIRPASDVLVSLQDDGQTLKVFINDDSKPSCVIRKVN